MHLNRAGIIPPRRLSIRMLLSVALRVSRTAGANALEVLFPPLCVVCAGIRDDASRWLCRSCREQLASNASGRPRCPRCSVNTTLRTCTCDLVWDHPFERIVSLFDYGDTLRRIMQMVKYQGMSRLAFDLAQAFAPHLPADLWDGIECVVPVPLHFWRHMRRGYNQAACLARGILAGAAPARVAYFGNIVVRRRHTRTQTKLDRDRRHANLRGAFAVRPGMKHKLAGRGVVLVDDVVTTGATCGACAQVLLEAGARCVRVVSLARD